MRAPRIRARLMWRANLTSHKNNQSPNCTICKNICVDQKRSKADHCDRVTRSVTKLMKDILVNKIIIYETYRCMPLLGDEKIHAPDWEQHIVRYHIVFDKNS